MNDRQDDRGGWTFFRGFWFVIGILLMVGFGFCGLCGLSFGAGSQLEGFLAFILPAFLLAFAGFLLARRMFVRRDDDGPDDRNERPWRY